MGFWGGGGIDTRVKRPKPIIDFNTNHFQKKDFSVFTKNFFFLMQFFLFEKSK